MEGPLDLDVKTAGDIFADPEASATVLHVIVLTAYSDALYGDVTKGIPPIDPIEMWLDIEEDFRTQLHENNENKINAMQMAMSTNAFYEDPAVFTAVCMSLYDGDMGDMVTGTMEDLTLPEILWGIYEVELNRDDQPEFSPRIVALIDKAIAEEAEEHDAEAETVIPYYEQIVEDKRNDMFEEMRLVGFPEKVIRRLAVADVTPRHDEQGETIANPTEDPVVAKL